MADDRFDGVVAAFDQDIGLGGEDEFHGGGLVKDDNGIHTGECCQDAAAFALTHDGAGWPFEAGDRGVTVDGDDELVAGAPSLFQDCDVADVEEIEAAVGKGHLVAVGAPNMHAIDEFFAGDKFVFGVERDLRREGRQEFVALDGNGADLADDDAGGDVGELDGCLRG